MTREQFAELILGAPALNVDVATFLAIPGMAKLIYTFANGNDESEDSIETELVLRIEHALEAVSDMNEFVSANRSGCSLHPNYGREIANLPSKVTERLLPVAAQVLLLHLKRQQG